MLQLLKMLAVFNSQKLTAPSQNLSVFPVPFGVGSVFLVCNSLVIALHGIAFAWVCLS